MRKREQSTGDNGSTLALKPMGRVNRSPKQRVTVAPQNGFKTRGRVNRSPKQREPVAPQNGDLSLQKKFKF